MVILAQFIRHEFSKQLHTQHYDSQTSTMSTTHTMMNSLTTWLQQLIQQVLPVNPLMKMMVVAFLDVATNDTILLCLLTGSSLLSCWMTCLDPGGESVIQVDNNILLSWLRLKPSLYDLLGPRRQIKNTDLMLLV